MKKILKIIASLVVILIIGSYFFIQSIAKSGLPDYNETVALTGLKEEVKIYRDEFGIPHIIAKNEADLYRVTGYLTAQDRMWQMDLLRRVTQGKLAEIFGEKMIGADQLFRSLQISEKSEKTLLKSDKEISSALEAFSDGVNQYIANDDLSFEFKVLGYKPELWKPEHSINLIGYMAWNLSTAWGSEISMFKVKQGVSKEIYDEIMVDIDYQNDVVYPNFTDKLITSNNLLNEYDKVKEIVPEIFNASNNWVVSGKKSATGKPIFANDMHLGLNIPGIWSQIHQHVEGKLDVTGVLLPGQPFVIAGHNDRIAWGMTNVGVDTMDFYIETVNKDTTQYMLDGKWKDFIIKKELIHTKEGQTIEKINRFTHRGPVISGFKKTNKLISMHWTGNEESNDIRTLFLLNRAKNWTEFKDACSSFKAVSQNIAYADVDGNIGLQCSAGIPIRPAKGNQIFPGETSQYDWNSFYPFEKLPYTYNPDCGYVFSANNRTTTSDSLYISSWFALPNRSNRIEQMLKEKERLSISDFKDMHTDVHSVMVDDMKPIIIKALANQKLSQIQTDAFNKLSNWNNELTKDSSEALIFETLYKTLGKNIVKDELGTELYNEFKKVNVLSSYMIDRIFKERESILCDDTNTKDYVENLDDIIVISFKETITSLSEQFGNSVVSWKWGDKHKLLLEHPLGKNKMLDYIFNLNRTYDAGGSFHTVNVFAYKSNYIAHHGASQRHIYSTANWDNSQTIIPTGISAIPASKHYCDQSEMYMNGEYHSDYISLEKIKELAVYKNSFQPK
ncbi:MAG TPA: penicillin acylase family protein [Lutibacter sp.]|nr:penicillin acylase family protein [Lutibacter sp.]